MIKQAFGSDSMTQRDAHRKNAMRTAATDKWYLGDNLGVVQGQQAGKLLCELLLGGRAPEVPAAGQLQSEVRL